MTKQPIDRADTIARVCHALSAGEPGEASEIARREYPFEPRAASRRNVNQLQATKVYMRDGFIDRYFGNKLIFPGALLLLSKLMPKEFPAHPNWKMSNSHIVYWELWPTIDHISPVARGGDHNEANWVSTSMLHNSIKDHWTLQELGWAIRPTGNLNEWDGLIHWYLETATANIPLVNTDSERRWYRAALAVCKGAN